ncbi:hypothetical protein TRVL_08420 [Trypanosoma vivax]|uniref:Uncharacterized protein n=1 Tax=Trypanosoma vivax (strain Y486) TaxID=1055687 RepID=G0TZR6_TRYVY|nr:hypothetical protein TRVL_08420 [Trypanosoma vivax]CCC50094.1 hypothetical protein TVY486_0807010 [Trypanosoma vivax Y486]
MQPCRNNIAVNRFCFMTLQPCARSNYIYRCITRLCGKPGSGRWPSERICPVQFPRASGGALQESQKLRGVDVQNGVSVGDREAYCEWFYLLNFTAQCLRLNFLSK